MQMLTHADEPTAVAVLDQALTFLTLWRPVLHQALGSAYGPDDLDNLLSAMAYAKLKAEAVAEGATV
jgi:hypothetical protein